jgi:hypothetical protein
MDKNIAAILREDAITIGVLFEGNEKQYTYVCTFPVKVGNRVVVDARGEFKVAYVARVDSDLQIRPDSSTQYKWVVDVIDLERYSRIEEENSEIETVVSKAYQSNMRRSFAATVLASIGEDAKNRLTSIIDPHKHLHVEE